MATLKLRFYGRFAYARAHSDGGLTGRISVIAPQFVPPLDPHRAMMSVRRDNVLIDPEFTSVPPLLKTLSDAENVLAAEMFIWDLAGHDVAFVTDPPSRPSASLGLEEPTRIIFDLADLVQRSGHGVPARLDLNALHASRNGKSQAVIDVTQGKGVARKVVDIDTAFLVSLADATDTDPEQDHHLGLVDSQTGQVKTIDKADLVEFDIDLPVLVPFTFKLTDPSTGMAGRISVFAREENETVRVNFSNLCSTIPREEIYDFEFAQYYSLLKANPGQQALVPKPLDPGGEQGDCETKAVITYDEKTGHSVR